MTTFVNQPCLVELPQGRCWLSQGHSGPHRQYPLCRNCGVRDGKNTWVGDGGVWASIHGGGVPWCDLCVVTAQLAYAKQLAEQIPDLERRVAEAQAADAVGQSPKNPT